MLLMSTSRPRVPVLGQNRWLIFEIFLREIKQVTHIFATTAADQLGDLKDHLPTIYRDFLKQRLRTHPDKVSSPLETLAHRFCKLLSLVSFGRRAA